MFQNIIRQRRSIRKYLPKKIEPDKIEELIEAALRAPSSRNFKPCSFIFVTESTTLAKLAHAKESGSAFLDNAALAVVVCADSARSDVWVEDASIASTYLLLAAESLDLGACWIQIRKRMHNSEMTAESYIAELLGIPDSLSVLSIIAIGYPDEQKSPHPREQLEHDKVHREKYRSNST
jgi:nitroreductase